MWALKNLAEVANTVFLLQYPFEAMALVLGPLLEVPNLDFYKLYLAWSCLLSQFLKGSYFLETGQAIE